MYDWSGTVSARAEQGQPTGLLLKSGDVISIIARGWIKYGYFDDQWAAPSGTVPMTHQLPGLLGTLVAKIGDKKYKIGSGVLRKTVPVDGELVLLFNDRTGAFGDNSGEFEVDIIIEHQQPKNYLEEIK
ncbi:LecA/PA-IL family lectin [Xenorhabdus bovienii]|uniref:LecA/PA-IL family lectin n=1 Tax=Xenorhabdus bovienii TaxID=40576 RepID=UPI0023B291B6|nr:LecA/PA-IL family lectin [Xenorhabdus bovienii]MDE9445753.1 LecA/PA-IL family lectin [Xenorhabdus bovienii]MDE9483078.1 LecA/PA-IL family lectin [Xenorhabdus bovienii]